MASTVLTSVALVYADGDTPVADRIDQYLTERGITVSRGRNQTPGSCIVVLLSAEGISDPEVLSLESHTKRLIPVKVDTFHERAVPARLGLLNWIMWDAQNPDRVCAMVLRATQTRLEDYRDARGLEAKAWAWQHAGRPQDELITEPRRLKELTRNAPDLGTGSRPGDGIVADFLQRSYARARQVRRRRRFQSVLALLLVPALVSASFALYEWRVDAKVAGTLQLSTADFASNRRPDVQALKQSGLVLQNLANQKRPHPALITELALALGQPWPESIIGVSLPKALNSLAFLRDSTRAVVGDGGGNIAIWDVASATPSRVRHISDNLLYHVATDQDGRTIMAADAAKTLYVVREGPEAPVKIRLAGIPDILAESADGALGAFALEGDIYRLNLTARTPRPELVARTDRVLDLKPASGGRPAALTRHGTALRLIDVRTGRLLWQRRVPSGEFEKGAVAGNGSLAVSSRGRLLWSDGIGDLRPTGQYVPDSLDALAVTRTQLIIYSGSAIGTRVFDMKNRIQLPTVCREIASLVDLGVAPREDRIYCQGGGVFSIWRPAPVRPEGPPASVPGKRRTESAGRVRRAELTADGMVAITWAERPGAPETTALLDPSARSLSRRSPGEAATLVLPGFNGPVTAVGIATGTDTILVGSSDGVAMEVDRAADGKWLVSSRWQAPDRLPVRSISVDQGMLRVSTTRFAWSIRSCAGCSANPLRLVVRAVQRQLPCYTKSLGKVMPANVRKALRIRLCAAP